jgi:two-component system LytT family response regulator
MHKAIIIDDEPKGRNILLQLITANIPSLKIVATAASADEGIKQIEIHKPSVVFLDVDMPRKNAFDMLTELGDIDFKIIFVTAHDHYAMHAIKFSALDYLLKPVDVEELHNAVNRLQNNISSKQVPQLLKQVKQNKDQFKKIAIASLNAIDFITIDDIIYCEADNVYTKIHLANKTIIATRHLKEYEDLLTQHFFFRIHHAHLININHIKKYIKGDGGVAIMSNDVELEVSRRRKTAFLELLSSI